MSKLLLDERVNRVVSSFLLKDSEKILFVSVTVIVIKRFFENLLHTGFSAENIGRVR